MNLKIIALLRVGLGRGGASRTQELRLCVTCRVKWYAGVQSKDAIIATVMDLHRCGALRRAVLCNVKNDVMGDLKYCVDAADLNGKVLGVSVL